jgi:DNA ligase (NAD+)
MTQLELQIKEAAQAYYSGEELMTDDEFDTLVDELRSVNPESELLQQIGWGYEVDEDITPGEKVPHTYGLVGSLSKAKTYKEVPKEFIKPNFGNSNLHLSAKLDGLSIVMDYVKGKLIAARTRGDGTVGVDITAKAKHILKNRDIDENFTGGIRGEIIMPKALFKEFKKLNPDAKHPRNSASGLISSDEITDDYRYLCIIPYSVIGVNVENMGELNVQSGMLDVMKFLEANFDRVVPYTFSKITPESFEAAGFKTSEPEIKVLEDLRDEWSEIYPIDGIVGTVQSLNWKGIAPYEDNILSIGQTSIAFKFKGATAISTVTHVEWTLSKTKYLVPRIWFKPVILDGSENQKVTGFNAKYIQDNKIGAGSVVEVQKMGDIIPNITKIIEAKGFEGLPTNCPVCDYELDWNYVRNSDGPVKGVHLMCTGPNCSGAIENDLEIWLENLAPIEGFGTILKFKYLRERFEGRLPSVEQLMEYMNKGFVYAGQHGAHDKMYNEMCSKLRNYKIKLVTAIKALNIPRLGDKTAHKFAEHPQLVKDCIFMGLFESVKLDGEACQGGTTYSMLTHSLKSTMGDANSESILKHIKKFARLDYISNRIVWEQPINTVEIKGKVAVTGKLSLSRSEFEQELRASGYIPGDLKKDSDFLITDDPTTGTSKNKKATEWGIRKITEQEFREQYMGAIPSKTTQSGSNRLF